MRCKVLYTTEQLCRQTDATPLLHIPSRVCRAAAAAAAAFVTWGKLASTLCDTQLQGVQ